MTLRTIKNVLWQQKRKELKLATVNMLPKVLCESDMLIGEFRFHFHNLDCKP